MLGASWTKAVGHVGRGRGRRGTARLGSVANLWRSRCDLCRPPLLQEAALTGKGLAIPDQTEPAVSLDLRTDIDESAKSRLAIELWQGDECVGPSEMDADGLDRLITHLARQRERLAKKTPMTLEDGERIRDKGTGVDVCFCQETDDKVLALRHSGFG